MSIAATPFLLDPAVLERLAEARADAYRSATPYPHLVVDGLIPAEIIRACAAEFPSTDDPIWDHYHDDGRTRKVASSDEGRMGPVTRQLIAQFSGPTMIRFLERLTGIQALVPDPGLLGGGMHQLEPGGFLDIHADFNRHVILELDRRLNVLLYLNEGWQEDWGGQFEMWDEEMERCRESLLPIAGRLVCFSTTSKSFHGNPRPVACPSGMARRSLAFYYYTNGRPDEERAPAHTTLYQRPGQAPGAKANGRRHERARALARDLAPPLLVRAARKAQTRRS